MHTTTSLYLLLGGAGMVSAACSITNNVKVTFYGVPDNDPAGSDAIAYSCSSRGFHAGGTGTYSDPLTFASASGSNYAQCEIIYVPYLKKYVRNEDICAGCTDGRWIDVFTGNSQNGGNAQVSCEDQLTPNASQGVIRSPASNLAVDTTPLWSSGTCNTGHIFASNNPSSYCSSGGSGGGSTCQTGCSWEGHCIGCACATFDDCSDDFVCTNGKCAAA
ncbi:hypothetical protein F5Y19DRAFT_402597 [Xylariaceae sp. FL1651]|nr:hypothetical protein F5Y19DRAFT_402597 [Xylariaceae sp. FL1651]